MRSSVVLPAPLGPSRPGDAAVEGEVDVCEGAGAAVALADAGQLDGARAGAHNATPGCRSVPARIAMTAQAATASAEVDALLRGLDRPGRRGRHASSRARRRHQPSDTTVAAIRGPTKPASASSTGTSARAGPSHAAASHGGPGTARPSSDGDRQHRHQDADRAQQDQPGATVRRGGDQRLERVLARAVGGGDTEHRRQGRREEERRERRPAGRVGGQRGEGQRQEGADQPGAAQRSRRSEQHRRRLRETEPPGEPHRVGQGRALDARRGCRPRCARAAAARAGVPPPPGRSAHRLTCCSTEAPVTASRSPAR